MTTDTQTTRLPGPIRKPIATVAVGVLLWAVGFAVGHVPYGPPVPGTAHYDAHTWSSLCAEGAIQTWPPSGSLATKSQACIHAPELVSLSDLLILGGIAMAATGTILIIRRSRRLSGSPETAQP